MGYQKIPNLYRDTRILEMCDEIYVLEKLHGTSSSVSFVKEQLRFFAGGVKHVEFVKLFDEESLAEKFAALGVEKITVFGEAYGGKCQGMKETYGPDLKFTAFEVRVDDEWMTVEEANKITDQLGLEFVHWVKGPANEAFVDKWRDAPSEQAKRNGMGKHIREGIVVRPVVEAVLSDGSRLIAKHKRIEFMESNTYQGLDPDIQKILSGADEVAHEHVTPVRLDHVLDKYKAEKLLENQDFQFDMRDTGNIVRRMIEDISIEEGVVIEWSKEVEKAIGKRTAMLFKKMLYKGNS